MKRYDDADIKRLLRELYSLDRLGIKRRLAKEHGRRNRLGAFRTEALVRARDFEDDAEELRSSALKYGDEIELSNFITLLLIELLDHYEEYPRKYTVRAETERPRKIRSRNKPDEGL